MLFETFLTGPFFSHIAAFVLKRDAKLHRCKNVFTCFILVTFLRFFNVFIFRTFFKIKIVENLLSMQADSEISVLHLTNDRLNCIGLLLLTCFQLSLCLPGPII